MEHLASTANWDSITSGDANTLWNSSLRYYNNPDVSYSPTAARGRNRTCHHMVPAGWKDDEGCNREDCKEEETNDDQRRFGDHGERQVHGVNLLHQDKTSGENPNSERKDTLEAETSRFLQSNYEFSLDIPSKRPERVPATSDQWRSSSAQVDQKNEVDSKDQGMQPRVSEANPRGLCRTFGTCRADREGLQGSFGFHYQHDIPRSRMHSGRVSELSTCFYNLRDARGYNLGRQVDRKFGQEENVEGDPTPTGHPATLWVLGRVYKGMGVFDINSDEGETIVAYHHLHPILNAPWYGNGEQSVVVHCAEGIYEFDSSFETRRLVGKSGEDVLDWIAGRMDTQEFEEPGRL